jgi:hypothetical protein
MIRNLLITFLLSGLWHGASWTFVVWGALHGAGVAVCALARRQRAEASVREGLLPGGRQVLAMAATFFFVCFGWVFFRAASLELAWVILKRITTRSFARFIDGMPNLGPALALVGVFVLLEWLQRHRAHLLVLEWGGRSVRWAAYTALLWLILYFQTSEPAPFIYFQF